MKICFFFPPSFQWLNFIKSRLSNTFAVTMCTDARIPWRNEVTRLMRISVVRGTQREKTATVTLVQNDLWACSECVWYTPWSWSCRICLNDIASSRYFILNRANHFFSRFIYWLKLFGCLIFDIQEWYCK